MRIDNFLPYNNLNSLQIAGRNDAAPSEIVKNAAPKESQWSSYYGPGVVVEISPEGRAAAAKLDKAQADSNSMQGIGGIEGPKECQTCKNRKYVDGSNDPSVSYQAPTHISPGQAGGAVMAHEREHVTNEQARADREGRKVVSQNVSISTSICPECGRVYVSGGVTRTVTKNDNSDKLADVINNQGDSDA